LSHATGWAPNGFPQAIYTGYGAHISFVVALPVAGGPPESVSEPPIRVEALPAADTYRFTHCGPYANLNKTHNLITEFMQEKGWLRAKWSGSGSSTNFSNPLKPRSSAFIGGQKSFR